MTLFYMIFFPQNGDLLGTPSSNMKAGLLSTLFCKKEKTGSEVVPAHEVHKLVPLFNRAFHHPHDVNLQG